MAVRVALYHRITAGIRISARPSYLPERPNPVLGQFTFAYDIRIEDIGQEPAQLLTRLGHP